MCAVEPPDALPESWIEEAEAEAGYEVPATLSEPQPPASHWDDAEAIGSIVRDVRRRIFPLHGLAI
jgi:hypothetical protein